MITIRKATAKDIELVMDSRLEMLKVVNHLPKEAVFEEKFIADTREYFEHGEQTTVLALANQADKDNAPEEVIGCATICYIYLMPTVDHPEGKRAHVMNVYTREQYRRQGIGCQMMNMLIDEAIQRKVTEISLDATQMGRLLYEKCGFTENEEGMVLDLRNRLISGVMKP